MSLWTGTAVNTNELAMVFNQLYNLRSIDVTRRLSGLLYYILGKKIPGKTPTSMTTFQKLKKITGRKVEVKILGAIPTPTYSANAAADLAAYDLAANYDADAFGAMEFDLSKLIYKEPVPGWEYDRFRGDEKKTLNWMNEVMTKVERGYERLVNPELNNTSAPATNKIGGWVYAVSDGVSTGETSYATYGTIDRSSAGNENFQSYVLNAGGSMSLKKLRKARNKVKIKHGNPRLGLIDEDGYTELESLLEAYTVIREDSQWFDFQGEWVRYGKVTYVLDADCPSQTIGLIDPDYFVFYMSDDPMFDASEVLVTDPTKTDAKLVPTKMYSQLLCTCPNAHAKIVSTGWA